MRRVLLDEDVPRQLRHELVGFEIRPVVEVGWSGLKNGEWLLRVEKSFDVFVTADRNLRFQQNLARFSIGIVVLEAASTKLEDLRPLVGEIRAAIENVKSGQVSLVPAS